MGNDRSFRCEIFSVDWIERVAHAQFWSIQDDNVMLNMGRRKNMQKTRYEIKKSPQYENSAGVSFLM